LSNAREMTRSYGPFMWLGSRAYLDGSASTSPWSLDRLSSSVAIVLGA
jgi:hypothetical protein